LIFSFFEFKFKFEFWGVSTARYRYRTPAVTAVTAVYRVVPSGKKKPWLESPKPTRPRLCVFVHLCPARLPSSTARSPCHRGFGRAHVRPLPSKRARRAAGTSAPRPQRACSGRLSFCRKSTPFLAEKSCGGENARRLLLLARSLAPSVRVVLYHADADTCLVRIACMFSHLYHACGVRVVPFLPRPPLRLTRTPHRFMGWVRLIRNSSHAGTESTDTFPITLARIKGSKSHEHAQDSRGSSRLLATCGVRV
jgi:hypothetical protein